MSIIAKVLRQTCVYWAPNGIDEHGNNLYVNCVQMKCRWDDRVSELLKKEGVSKISKATVLVEKDVELGGALMLGTLEDVLYLDRPFQNKNCFEIMQYGKTPNFKATEFLRLVELGKYYGTGL